MPVDRSGFIGSSDAAAVLGKSRWSTPLEVWALKTGAIESKNEDTEAIELGRELEDYVARRFMKKTGKKVVRVNEPFTHQKYPFLKAQVDRRVVGEKTILECKTASAWKAKEWKDDDIPLEYILQVYHQLALTGADKAYIAVLIGNQEFKWKEIQRDERVQKDLIEREVQFWQEFVVPKIMPTTITKHDKDTLDELFPEANPSKEILIESADDANKLCENIESFKADIRHTEGLLAQAENTLKAMLGDAESGITNLYRIFWSNQTRNGLDTKKLKQDRPDLYEEFTKTTNLRVFKVKLVNEI